MNNNKIPRPHQTTNTATANMPNGLSLPLPTDRRHTGPVIAALTTRAKPAPIASDAASTRSSSSFASTVSLLKDSFKDKSDKKETKAKDASRPRSERYASTMVNQC